MRVRFSIDRLVIDGVELSPIERVRLEEELRESLHEALLVRLAVARRQPGSLPVARNARSERLGLGTHGQFASGHLGEALGATLAGHVWGGAPRDSK